MKLNKLELKKIIYGFNSISNRLMQANYNDYNWVLMKFVAYLRENEIINDYIVDCGECEQNLPQEFQEIMQSYGQARFSVGPTDKEEVRDVYAILLYIIDNDIEVYSRIALSYDSSRNYQDKIKSFNERFVMILIRHIETYLVKVGIDMGLDEKTSYSITITNGQINIANDNSTINATSKVNAEDTAKLLELIEAVRGVSKSLATEQDRDILATSLEIISEEFATEKPRVGYIKNAISGLSAIKGTTEFMASVATLINFIQSVL